MAQKTPYNTNEYSDFVPKNRKDLAFLLEACIDINHQNQIDVAFGYPYSLYLKNILNLELTAEARRFELEEVLAYRAYVANEERRREKEAFIKDEIARENNQDRRLFERKEDVLKTMQEVVYDKDISELKELKAVLPVHIEALKLQIADLNAQIEAHATRREEIAANVQALSVAHAQEFATYLEENPSELVSPTGEALIITEAIREEIKNAVASTNSCIACKVNPGLEEKIHDEYDDPRDAARFCFARDLLVNALKSSFITGNSLGLGIGVPLTKFVHLNKGKQSLEGLDPTEETESQFINEYTSHFSKGIAIRQAKKERDASVNKLVRAEALQIAVENAIKVPSPVTSSKK